MTTAPTVQEELLKKVRAGLPWLIKAQDAFLADQPTKTTTDDFLRVFDECAVMEQMVRLGAYTGCIFGDAGPCPENAIITCDACMSEPPA